MKFLHFFIIILILGVPFQTISQQVQIYYSDVYTMRVVDRPIYEYVFEQDLKKVIKIDDSFFVNYLQGIIDTLKPDTIMWTASLGPSPVHIILQKEDLGEFFTIDLDLTTEAESNTPSPLWVDGKRKMFSPKFQQIIDDLVKSKILHNTDVNDPSFLISIMEQNGLKLNLFQPEIPHNLEDLDN